MRLLHASYFNFKILKNTHINFHESATLLVGKNNSGKTTILEGLYRLLKESISLSSTKGKNEVHSNYINKKTTSNEYNILLIVRMEEEDLLEISQELNESNSISSIDDKRKFNLLSKPIVITLSYNKKEGFELTYDFLNVFEPQWSWRRYISETDLEELLTAFVNKLSERTIFISPDRKLPDRESFTAFNIIKNDPEKDQFIRHYLIRLKEKYPDRFSTFQKEFRRIFYDVELNPIIDQDDGLVKIQVKQDDSLFDINDMGSGFKYLLLIIAKILSLNAKIIIIDEPDLNMHPDLIKKFVKYLKNDFGLQIIVSSHNETFINEFDDDSIRYVYSLKNYSAHVKDIEESLWLNLMEDLGIVMSNFGKSRLVSSPLVVLFEGCEKRIFDKLVERKGLTDKLQSLNILYEDTGGTNRVPDFQMLDKIDNRIQPIIVVRDRDENNDAFIQQQVSRSRNRIFYWKRRDIESYAFSYEGILNTIKKKALRRQMIDDEITNLTLEKVKEVLKNETMILKKEILLLRVLQRYKILQLLNYTELSSFKEQNLSKPINEIIASLIELFDNKYKIINKEDLRKFFDKEKTILDKEWSDETILKICSGKKLLTILNKWLSKYAINVSILELIENQTEVDSDVEDLVNKIYETYNLIEPAKSKREEKAIKLDVILKKEFFSKIEPNSIVFDSKSNLIYLKGYCDPRKKIDLENVVGVLDSNTLEFKDSIIVGIGDENWVNIKRIFFDIESKKLFVSCVYQRKRGSRGKACDSVYIIDTTDNLVKERIDLYETSDDGKEGYVADLVFNNKYNKLYVSSVYAEGGNRGIYIKTLTKPDHSLLKMRGPGALNLLKIENKVFATGRTDEDQPCVYEIDCEHDDISQILIKGRPGDSYRGPERISCDFALNLYILTDNLMEVVSLINRKSVNSMINRGCSQVITNLVTGRTFVRFDQTKNGVDSSIISIINDDFELEPFFDEGNILYFNISPSTGDIFAILNGNSKNEYKLVTLTNN